MSRSRQKSKLQSRNSFTGHSVNIYSDHVHRFFGAVSPRTLRPDATFRDLRDADGDTGNVEENRSLYWNPVIYKVAT